MRNRYETMTSGCRWVVGRRIMHAQSEPENYERIKQSSHRLSLFDQCVPFACLHGQAAFQ